MRFQPRLYDIEIIRVAEQLRPGDSYGQGIVTNEKKVCYEKKESNCVVCVASCPFNRNPNRKES